MVRALLLRAPTTDEPDRYETVFRDHGLKPVSVSVVETGYTNLDTLKDIVIAGPEKGGYSGVIVTSARSCEAWKVVVVQLVEEDAQQEEGQTSETAIRLMLYCDLLTGRAQNTGLAYPSTPSARRLRGLCSLFVTSTAGARTTRPLKGTSAVRSRRGRPRSSRSTSSTTLQARPPGCSTSRAIRTAIRCREYWGAQAWT